MGEGGKWPLHQSASGQPPVTPNRRLLKPEIVLGFHSILSSRVHSGRSGAGVGPGGGDGVAAGAGGEIPLAVGVGAGVTPVGEDVGVGDGVAPISVPGAVGVSWAADSGVAGAPAVGTVVATVGAWVGVGVAVEVAASDWGVSAATGAEVAIGTTCRSDVGVGVGSRVGVGVGVIAGGEIYVATVTSETEVEDGVAPAVMAGAAIERSSRGPSTRNGTATGKAVISLSGAGVGLAPPQAAATDKSSKRGMPKVFIGMIGTAAS